MDLRGIGDNRRRYREQAYQWWLANNYCCWICGEEIDKGVLWPHPKSFTSDHIVPLACGGKVDGEC